MSFPFAYMGIKVTVSSLPIMTNLTFQKIQLSFNANEGDLTAYIDSSKMERVLGELISNAIKYTPENGTVEVTLKKDDDNVSLSVKDSGIGMTAEECEKIWERFYRTSVEYND